MALTDQLVDAWPFTEGGGTVAAGAKGDVDLVLGRTDQFSGDPLPTAAGWTTESVTGRPTYNGGGIANLVASGFTLLAATGQAVTMAARIWLGGGMSVQPSYDAGDSCMLMGLRGHTDVNEFSESDGWRLYTGAGDLLDNVIIEGVPGTLFIPDWEISLGSPPAYTKHLFVVTVERLATQERIRLAVDGVFKSEVVLSSGTDYSEPSKAGFGGLHWCRGSVSQAALWQRKLSDSEVASFGDNLDVLFGQIEDPPLLDDDGASALVFVYPSERSRPVAVLATSSHARHARRASERTRRRYRLRCEKATGAQLDLVLQAMASSSHGAAAVRFRHPVDDAPGTPESAPLYRIVNGHEFAITRTRGGQRAAFDFEIEEY